MPVYDPNNPYLFQPGYIGGPSGSDLINRSTFAGMSISQVQVWYASAQAAYLQLSIGGKPVTVSYEGKSVTYTAIDASRLKNLIDEAQQILGYGRQRRALRPIFR